jgi:hydrogenase expression/formation protein HypE
MTAQLIESVFLPNFNSSALHAMEDAADFKVAGAHLAISTDSYVIKPLLFDGGDIGSLSVYGTINDLCMRLAQPLCLSAAFILEEGFPLKELEVIIQSAQNACLEAGVEIVAADTKVVNKGAGDGVYITTTGIGLITVEHPPSASRAQPGDAIIVSGDVGRHGMSILCRREGIELETDLKSDSACLKEITQQIAALDADVHCLRDLTRGGLSSALNELAESSSVGIEIGEHDVPLVPAVKASCELLGLDPLHVACEGRFVAIVSENESIAVLEAMRANELGQGAAIIGKVVAEHKGIVVMQSTVGGRRILDKLSGDQLPRIC